MTQIKFGTDGWRAIIAQDYTVDNVRRIADATARWMLSKGMSRIVIGYDTRFGGKMFANATACVCADRGLKVILGDRFVSTPMVSLAIVKTSSDMGVVITASHNPPSYNGYKLKSSFGGPTIPSEIAEVEAMILDEIPEESITIESHIENGNIEYHDLEGIYIEHVEAHFDLEAIKNSHINLAYDAMYGAGQNALKVLFPDALLMHCDNNPGFKGQAPEPIMRNLKDISNTIHNSPSLNLGLANDGDADRVGMFDEDGNFVDAHHLLLLLLYYLAKFKGMSGKVVVSFSVTDKMKILADHFGFDIEVTKIGFKYIAEIMIKEDVIVGGEESGGLAAKGHIPERDGIWMGLLIMEFMAKTGKSIKELVQEVYEIVGPFSYDRDDLKISNEKKWAIIEKCKNGEITRIGNREIVKTEIIDGYRFTTSDGEWVMVRPSGTEPVLRVYAQAKDAQAVRALLDDTHMQLNEQ
jgi:phosphomannomutase